MKGRSLAAAAMLLLAVACGDDGGNAASSSVRSVTTLGDDHREVDITFTSAGTPIAGTLYLPASEGPHAAVVWVHGSGEAERLGYGALVSALNESSIAFFSYDKRGVGESGGECCPADDEGAGLHEFGQQADDALAGIEALASQPDVDAERVGFLGVSQAGWIVPIAATRSPAVAFAILVAAPTVTTGVEAFYSGLTGDEAVTDPAKREDLSAEVSSHPPSGFDPAPLIAEMTVPGLWLYGAADGSVPVPASVAVLDELKGKGQAIEYVVFPNGAHGLLDVDPPPPPEVIPTIVKWLRDNGFT